MYCSEFFIYAFTHSLSFSLSVKVNDQGEVFGLLRRGRQLLYSLTPQPLTAHVPPNRDAAQHAFGSGAGKVCIYNGDTGYNLHRQAVACVCVCVCVYVCVCVCPWIYLSGVFVVTIIIYTSISFIVVLVILIIFHLLMVIIMVNFHFFFRVYVNWPLAAFPHPSPSLLPSPS